ncbi:oxidoreductase [Reichenbachiella versicolor]|uniref:oxidoreductase n=1 Tax=Reichenbachiella versicolor TaxID=1821036 RepID=UPI000D6DF59B|nr:oxidoreductase [Reichenbachiella versicolor]
MEKKIWLITGASSGLGKALAESVMREGDFAIGTFRNEKQVSEFKNNNLNNGDAVLLDITNEHQINATVSELINKYGRIDVLVNNAGFGFIGAIEESSLDEVKSVMDTNFYGALNMTKAILPYMREEKNGHVIQISSHGGFKAFSGFGIYNASKFALEGFSEALAQEVEPLGIKVTIVQPGPFRTNFANTGLSEATQIIDDYSNTAGVFRSKIKSANGLQEGDPIKAAKAIYNHTKLENLTLRLPLGKTATITISQKLNHVKSELEANIEIAKSTVFNES